MKLLKEIKLSNLVKWSAFVIPVVPAASMADQVFKDVTVGTSFAQIFWLTLALSFVGGVGYEMVGIGAGHLSVRYFVEKNWVFFTLSVSALFTYVAIGFYKFGTSTSGLFLIIAPFVYLLSGMIESSEITAEQDRKEQERLQEIQEQERLRQIEIDKLNHELELEERKAKAVFAREQKAKQAEFKRQQRAVNGVAEKVASGVADGLQALAQLVADETIYNRLLPEVRGTKKSIVETLRATPDATRAQLATKAGVTPQAISKNVSGLNKMLGSFSSN